jgi:F-type H+-transporting ATPase subunit b
MPEIFHDAEFWVLIAFLIAVAFLVYKAKDRVLAGLDDRSARIKTELDEARRLANESQENLARFQRRQRDALKESEAIIALARDEAKRAAEAAKADLAAALERRKRQAIERVALAEARATSEIRHAAIEVALAALRRLLAQTIDAKQRAALIDDAIEALPPTLH